MVKFLISQEGGIFPTKLNKAMFYADFLNYKQRGISISGLEYQAIQYGPVPVHYDTIYDNINGIDKEIVISNVPTLLCDKCFSATATFNRILARPYIVSAYCPATICYTLAYTSQIRVPV